MRWESGSIVTFEPSRLRVRALPINTSLIDQRIDNSPNGCVT